MSAREAVYGQWLAVTFAACLLTWWGANQTAALTVLFVGQLASGWIACNDWRDRRGRIISPRSLFWF